MDYTKWSSKDLAQQLTNLGFSAYARNFRVNEIKGCHLPNVTEDHLKEMGITKIGHRILLLKRIRQIVDGETPKPVKINAQDSNPSSRPSSNLSSAPPIQQEQENNIPPRIAQRRQLQQAQQAAPEPQMQIQQKMAQQLQQLNQEPAKEPSSGRTSKIRYPSSHSSREQKETFSSQEPPPSESSGDGEEKVTCQYCGRKLPPDAAKRHIPVCAKIRGKTAKK
ncbi:hypothetical protein TVAG_495640 [Trichomonas vaginalis G3]|uniref:Uncharacterized protein n=1 Tax=Trichomonas vaginalis (strain ATCC PRA-98 / G3) TaxID=412133 RepID=A2DVK6_TRIV3|nr:somatostatin receptor binding [Trichomonas vaginalis G3]EAY15548.1 hypothetical protein TVAG_495640 [Trichomonas vaginalis G3]KAI5526194.1 somatostatin receptor binding [Trichomonas vaginalis G3]|eukprot:XP_001327771.1 hypothetical protein [Trichomonas vaginalis G3]